MDPIKLTPSQMLMYGALINAGIGFAFGLVPLAFGFVKKNLRYGILGLVACVVGGAVLGILLSVPAMIIFTWLIVKGGKSTTAASDPIREKDAS